MIGGRPGWVVAAVLLRIKERKMSQNIDVLKVTARDVFGKRAMKELRASGQVPLNLYGHGEANVHLSVKADHLEAAIRHGAHMVELEGAVADSALIREVQWDTFATRVLHVDLTRVDSSEMVEAVLEIELRGEAPGIRAGGVVEQPAHSLRIRCPAGKIPEKLVLSINALELEDALTAGDMELPEGAELLSEPHELVVQCVARVEIDEEGEAALDSAEPEVIGRRAQDEEAAE